MNVKWMLMALSLFLLLHLIWSPHWLPWQRLPVIQNHRCIRTTNQLQSMLLHGFNNLEQSPPPSLSPPRPLERGFQHLQNESHRQSFFCFSENKTKSNKEIKANWIRLARNQPEKRLNKAVRRRGSPYRDRFVIRLCHRPNNVPTTNQIQSEPKNKKM